MPPTKESQLKAILELLNTSATKGEVLDAFKAIMELVKSVQKSNEKEWSLIKSAVSMLGEKLKEDATTEAERVIAQAQKKLMDTMMSKMQMMMKEHDAKMLAADEKIDSLQSIKGDKGDPGENANHDFIIEQVLSKIPKPKDGYTPKKGVDYFDGEDGTTRIGWGAHPLVIQGDGTTVEKVARNINFVGGNVSRSPSGVVTVNLVPGSGTGITGTVNGSNLTFTAATTPTIVFTEGGHFINGFGVTITGLTIVFDQGLAPQQWIKYV